MTGHDRTRARAPLLIERIFSEVRGRRLSATGKARLSDRETRRIAAIVDLGGTVADLDEALATFRERLAAGRAPAGEAGWRYALRIWQRDVTARHEALTAKPATAAAKPDALDAGAVQAVKIAPRLSRGALAEELDRRQRAGGYVHVSELRRPRGA